MKDLFLERSVPELMDGLRDGEFTFEDLGCACVSAVTARDPETCAWVCFEGDRLLDESKGVAARQASRGYPLPLEGIPFGVKDIFNTREFPTQMGSPIWKDFTPGNNARVVDSLVMAGALVAGKTVTAEFAVHALNETLNPHDPTRTPGTSSSGSAAAVATGMVPFALGSQTAGSIVRPSSFCGIWGMKPSFGLIPRTAVLKTTDSLDTIGFVASHAASLRPILDHTRVSGPDYPFVYRNVDAAGGRPRQAGERWRVGFIRTHTWDGATDYARAAIEQLADRIAGEAGFDVEEVRWPEELSSAHEIHSTIYAKSLSYYFQHEANFTTYVSPLMAEMIADGKSIGKVEFQTALRKQEHLAETLDGVLMPYDLVLSLGTASAAPARGVMELPDPSLIWTLGHVPSVAVPAFRSPENLPFGAQIISRRWNDYLLLQGIEELVERGVLPSGSQKIERWG